jgi:serine/threonine-protein kinase
MPIDHIGRYKIEKELGKGAMGVVYKATDPNIGRTVALKTLRVDVSGMESEEMVKRFHAEARNAGVLNHAHIVTIYDAQELEGIFYIAMEYIQGQTLQEALRMGTLPVEKVIDITRQVCAGLDYASERGIIHRDIKPANIMIVPDGTVKIMDFGIAKSAGTGMTSTGQVLGTPNYMSPEQVKGKTLDGRSDLFSLGVVLYEMLTGERPFTGENVTTIIYKIVNEHPPAPRDLDGTVPAGLSAVVMKALAKNREERYQKGADLAKDLENHQKFGADAGPMTVILSDQAFPEVVHPPMRATSGTVAMPKSAAAAPKAAPKIASPVAVQQKVAPPKKAPVVAKSQKGPLVLGAVALAIVLAVAGYVGLKMKSKPAEQPAPATSAPSAVAPEVKKPAEAKPAETPGTAAAVSSAAAPTTGELRVSSTPPGAKFTIDGRAESRFVAPFNLPKLKEGPHTVVLTLDGYQPATKRVDVVAGKRASLNAALVATSGFISVTTNPPGASISVDEKPTGEFTPARIKVDPGQHKISVHKPGYREQTMSLSILAGQTFPMSFPAASPGSASVQPAPTTPASASQPKQPATSQNVPPSNMPQAQQQQPAKEGGNPFRKLGKLFGSKEDGGTLEIRTNPKGAEVLVNGNPTGKKTPVKTASPVGAYTITLRLEGYKPITRTIQVTKGQTTGMEETLEKQ